MHECWNKGNVVVTLMGDICTRACNDCTPGYPEELDKTEIDRVVKGLKKLDLDYVILTAVKRDDLRHMGASHIAECIKKVKQEIPGVILEVIIPDFKDDRKAIKMVVDSRPDVITHNIETVKSLYKEFVDPRSNFDKSINVLKTIKELNPSIYTKSFIMLGLGESKEEVIKAMGSLRKAKVDILTLGQYLKANEWHADIKEYVHPLVFDYLKTIGRNMGFLHVESGPFVRSSYMAGDLFLKSLIRKKKSGK